MALEDDLDLIEDLQHDLGKYICFETRFVDEQAPTAELYRALRTDLYETRRSANGKESAWEIWERIVPSELQDEPELQAIAIKLAELRALDLDRSEPQREVMNRARNLCQEVAHLCRQLLQRARRSVHG